MTKLERISEESSSSSASKYQVFLSFRGPDTRQAFTDTLFESLKDAGVRVFRDDNELRVGHEIGKDLIQAIHDSQIYIPIFSKNYAKSKWCLRELAEMVKESRNSKDDKEIIPIFYDVTTGDVKGSKGLYGKAVHAHKQDRETVQQWKEALREVCTIKGWELKDQGHAKFCKSVVKEIGIKLRVKHKQVTDCLVGMDGQVKALTDLLDVESDGVRVVGIHGMGGIGKTTLAKVVFNRLFKSFDACSFISDVRETSNSKGLVHLQKQLLKDLGCSVEIDDEDDGVKSIMAVSCTKKVLIVLDDVSQRKQIEKLAGASGWFGARSRIIITTRDKQNFEIKGQKVKRFEKEHLDGEQALELFSLHAFGEKDPPEDYLTLSKEVISFTGGLPLAMEIIGSLLHGCVVEFWRNKIEELKVIPHEDVQKKLMISYESLDSCEKEIFLDIACFFDGEETTYPIYMWDACGFFPKTKVDVLVDRSLIKIKDLERDRNLWIHGRYRDTGRDRIFWMHDQVKDLGRKIVREENLEHPEERSRIWEEKEALKILKHLKKGRRGKIKAIRLQQSVPSSLEGHTLTREELGGLENLRFLQLPYFARIAGDVQDCLPNLRWFSLESCNSVMKATNFSMNDLVILMLTWSDVRECWEGWNQLKGMETLKVLDLTGSRSLRKTPDLSGCKGLEKLILNSCTNLIELDPSIGNLKSLKYLDCEDCYSLGGLPEEISSLETLKVLDLKGCSSLRKTPDLSGCKGLEKLILRECTNLIELDPSIGNLKSVKYLDCKNCDSLRGLPEEISSLETLKVLDLTGCSSLRKTPDLSGCKGLEKLILNSCGNLIELDPTIGNLKSVKYLDCNGCDSLIGLPEEISSLETLDLTRCSSLRKTPDLSGCKGLEKLILNSCRNLIELDPSIGNLKSLKYLDCKDCDSLRGLPEEISSLEELECIIVCGSRLQPFNLPELIGSLKSLKILRLDCLNISKLPHSIGDLKSLVELSLNYVYITELPNSIGGLVNLESLALQSTKVTELPDAIGNLKSLRVLYIRDTRIRELPDCIGNLKSLESLIMERCDQIRKLPGSIGKLKQLKEIRASHSGLCDISIEIGRLPCLRLLDLSFTSIRGLPQLPLSLEVLCFISDSLKELPDLSNCTNLIDLYLKGSQLECSNMDWIRRCAKLERLSLGIFKFVSPSAELLTDSTTISGQGSIELAAPLKVFTMAHCDELGDNEFQLLLAEMKLVNLKRLEILSCNAFERLCNLPKLVHLEELYITECENLKEIGRLGEFTALKKLEIVNCHSLKRVRGLSKLGHLEVLDIYECENLEEVEGLGELASLKRSSINESWKE